MIKFYLKYKVYLWSFVLSSLFFNIGLIISYSSLHKTKIHSLVDVNEDEQVLISKLSIQVHQMADNGFFCHLGGMNSENMKSEFCQELQINRQKSAVYSLHLIQQLINKKCESHDLYVGLTQFANVLDIVSRNEDDEMFQFTNESLRSAFINQSKIFETINIKKICKWN